MPEPVAGRAASNSGRRPGGWPGSGQPRWPARRARRPGELLRPRPRACGQRRARPRGAGDAAAGRTGLDEHVLADQVARPRRRPRAAAAAWSAESSQNRAARLPSRGTASTMSAGLPIGRAGARVDQRRSAAEQRHQGLVTPKTPSGGGLSVSSETHGWAPASSAAAEAGVRPPPLVPDVGDDRAVAVRRPTGQQLDALVGDVEPAEADSRSSLRPGPPGLAGGTFSSPLPRPPLPGPPPAKAVARCAATGQQARRPPARPGTATPPSQRSQPGQRRRRGAWFTGPERSC